MQKLLDKRSFLGFKYEKKNIFNFNDLDDDDVILSFVKFEGSDTS